MFASRKWYTLESDIYGTWHVNGKIKEFLSYQDAYANLVAIWQVESAKGVDHGYWFIKEHYKTKSTDDNGKVYENEMVQPVWR